MATIGDGGNFDGVDGFGTGGGAGCGSAAGWPGVAAEPGPLLPAPSGGSLWALSVMM